MTMTLDEIVKLCFNEIAENSQLQEKKKEMKTI